jgi:hypothetical protein
MRWWNDLWLNEGFANYMQFYGSNASAPEFAPMQRVTIDTTQRALDFDAGTGAVPIHFTDFENAATPPSAIVYDKGASIIRMMNAFLTKDTLINGLQQYLKDKLVSHIRFWSQINHSNHSIPYVVSLSRASWRSDLVLRLMIYHRIEKKVSAPLGHEGWVWNEPLHNLLILISDLA